MTPTPDRVPAEIAALPKAELHVHIEGALEPETAFACARRNGITLPFADEAELRRRYDFGQLQEFLDLYFTTMGALRTPADFTELADDYLTNAHAHGVRHAEIFFDPQAHTSRGVALTDVLDGLEASLSTAQHRFGISTRLIACFLRDRGPDAAMATMDALGPHLHRITGVGLDSAELGYPPADFAKVFARAREAGLHLVAHAGEEGPADYVRQALDVLGVERIDHGIQAVHDPALIRRLATERTPLTVCPLSNVRLRCVPDLATHPLPRLLDAGVLTTINSDDPAYFGGHVGANFHALRENLGLSLDELRHLAASSFEAAFLDESQRRQHQQNGRNGFA